VVCLGHHHQKSSLSQFALKIEVHNFVFEVNSDDISAGREAVVEFDPQNFL
jgi:hypothetical protein